MNNAYRPGAHERHLLRRQDNPLFPPQSRRHDAATLAAARVRDEGEREAFVQRFHALLETAVQLKPNEESETLLNLKAQLDQAYTLLASLGGDTEPYKQGVRRLTETVMAAVQHAAAGDALAGEELAQERMARQQHYRLLEFPLVADLMRPDSPVEAAEVVATLLSASHEELDAVLWLFGPDELEALCHEARGLLAVTSTVQGRENLAVMESRLGRA